MKSFSNLGEDKKKNGVIYNLEDYPEPDKEDAELIREILYLEVVYMGKNIPEALKKIFSLARLFLNKQPVILIDDNAITFDTLSKQFYYKAIFASMKDSCIISNCTTFEDIILFDKYYGIKGGRIIE